MFHLTIYIQTYIYYIHVCIYVYIYIYYVCVCTCENSVLGLKVNHLWLCSHTFLFFIQRMRVTYPYTRNNQSVKRSFPLEEYTGVLSYLDLFSFYYFHDLKGPHCNSVRRESTVLKATIEGQ